MNTPVKTPSFNTPRLIPTIVAGFNTVASHVQLILIPIIVDLLLWLGPKIKVDQLIQPAINSFSSYLLAAATADTKPQITDAISTIKEIFNQFNLGVAIRTVPVGIPSLLARELTVDSPIKNIYTYEVPTAGMALLIILGLSLVGFFIGTLYFNALNKFTAPQTQPSISRNIFALYGENLVTALILLTILLIIMIPGSAILAAATMISPAVGQFLIWTAILIIIWLAVPLIFAPHGIFVLNQKAYPSMLLSIRMVRYFLPGAGLFITTSVLISEGLNMLWVIPDPTSWLTLIGIFGHSFIVTALLAASFIYYRGGLKWMQESIQNITDPNIKAKLGGPFGSK